MMGLLLWCLGMATAGLYGIAILAQLKAERLRAGGVGEAAELTAEAPRTILTR